MSVSYRQLAASFILAISIGGCGGSSGGAAAGSGGSNPPPPPPPAVGYQSPQAIGLERLRNASQVPINVSFERGVPRWISLDVAMSGNSAEEGARNFLYDYQDLLGQESLIEETDRRQLSFATRYTTREDAPETFDFVRLAQSYDDVPVFGAEMIVGVLKGDSADGRIVTMSGRFMGAPRAPIDVIPAISEQQALDAARTHLGLPTATASGPIVRVVFDPLLGREEGEPRLAWLVPIGGGAAHEMLVDAHDGSVLLANPLSYDAYSDFDLDLEDANGGTIANTNCFNPTTLDDTAGDEDGLVSAYSSDQNAIWSRNWAIDTADWYYDKLGQRSIDDDDEQLEVYIHSGISPSKAGAYSHGCGIEIVTGAPSNDLLTHEFTHGVIAYSSRLVYKNQSGALNESYADTMAAFADYSQDWLQGEQRLNGGGPYRSLRNPPGPDCGPNRDENCGDPDKISDWLVTTNDNGGVHTNSGIMNKAHFLISEGQQFGLSTPVVGMGSGKAQKLLYWSMKHLPKWAGFLDARQMDIGYAEFFVDAGWYGFTSNDVCTVREAFAAVEIGFGDFDCDGVDNSVDDPDNDFINSNVDNCPNVSNPTQWDGDQDGIGSACDDDDDNDGIEDTVDNCQETYNPGQQNHDDDSLGDACDPDDDNDDVPDIEDNCPGDPNTDQFDGNNNGWGDACDPDYDGDGLYTDLDNCNFVANPPERGVQADADDDGIGDACDKCPNTSDNGNAYTTGIPELGIIPTPLQPDSDDDGLPDACDDMPHGTTTLVSIGGEPPNPSNPSGVGSTSTVSIQGATAGTFVDILVDLCPPETDRPPAEDTDRIQFVFNGLENALTASLIDSNGTRVAYTHEANSTNRGMRIKPDCSERYTVRVEFGPDSEPDYDFDIAIERVADTGVNPWQSYRKSANALLANLSLSALSLDQLFQSNLFTYTGDVPFSVSNTSVTPTAEEANATITVNGIDNVSGAASDPINLATGSTLISVQVIAENGIATQAYTVNVTREAASSFAQSAYIKASNASAGDVFGHVVAIDGDTMVVGAYLEDSDAIGVDGTQGNDLRPNSGAAYVFTRDGSGAWSQQAYLKASNPDNSDEFGRRVAISGDTVVISAPMERSAATGINGNQVDNSATGAGAVYVFTRDLAGLWSQQAYVKASNTSTVFPGDNFGESVSIDGDTLVVGATGEASEADGVNANQSDITAEGAGAAYVYVRDGIGNWSQQAYIKASNSDVGELFGSDVVVDGDTLAVSAMNEDSGASGINGNQGDQSARGSGAVYVYTRDGAGDWTQQAYIKASHVDAAAVGDRFGINIDLDSNTLVVGANLEDSSATGINGDETDNSVASAGAVYAFVRDAGGAWSQQAYIKASNTTLGTGSGGQFGFSVALAGDTLLVGAPNEASAATGINGDQSDFSAAQAGAAYLFTRDSSGAWSQEVYVKASNTNAFDRFGQSVSLDGTSSAIGASGEASEAAGINGDQQDNTSASSGAVYEFR